MAIVIDGTGSITGLSAGGLPDNSITTNDIAANAITEAKLATGLYTCKAWVNFNGTGTVAIRASGNVSSITDNGTGDYTVNFTTAMPDANYAVSSILSNAQSVGNSTKILASNNTSSPTTMTTSACRLVYVTNSTAEDYNTITAMFVR